MPEKTTDEMVRELYAIEQIKRVKLRNMRALDLKNWDEMAETFTEDATTAWVDGEISLAGRDAIMEFLKTTPFATGNVAITVHQAAGAEIELTSETTARGTWRLYNPVWFRDFGRNALLLAFYHDEYRREEDGEWRISFTSHEHIWEESYDRGDLPSIDVSAQHAF